nr:hypothetical protein [uncultured Arsenicibacter sp.]
MTYRSSVFPTQEPDIKSVDCRPNAPSVIIHYDGSTTDVPQLSQGTISFPGAKVNLPGSGVGGNGNDFKIDFDSIPKGGAGVKLRACVPAQKRILRFYCSTNPCTNCGSDALSMQIKPLHVCERPVEYYYENPIFVDAVEGCAETCEQMLNLLAKRWNQFYSDFGTATVVQVGNKSALQVEEKIAGELTYHIVATEGLTDPIVISPAVPGTYSKDLIKEWFSPIPFPSCPEPDECVKVIEMFPVISFPGESAGVLTSNLSESTQSSSIQATQTVAFITANNTNGNNARAALLSILRGGNNAYLAKISNDATAVDVPLYMHSVVREDDGSPAAYATAKADYSGALQMWRKATGGGKSYYELLTSSPTAPVAAGDDVVTAGSANVPNLTYA